MKNLKIYIGLVMLFTVLAFTLTFFSGGNRIVDNIYQAKVISCEESSNSGLETYYTVAYTYTNNEGSGTSGFDNYYPDKVEKGDTITVTVRETVRGKYSIVLFYMMVFCYVGIGISCIPLGVYFFRLLKDINKTLR